MTTITEAMEKEKLSRFNNVSLNTDKLNNISLLERAAEENKTVSIGIDQIKLNENIRNRIDVSKPEFQDLKNSLFHRNELNTYKMCLK